MVLFGMAGIRDWWLQPWMPMGMERKRQEPLKWARAELRMSWQNKKPRSQYKAWWYSGTRMGREICYGRAWKAEWTEQWARTKTRCYEEILIRGTWQVFLAVRGWRSRRGGLQKVQRLDQAGSGWDKHWHLHPVPQALAWKSFAGVGAGKTWVITQSLNMHPTLLQASHLIKLCHRVLMGLAR